MKPQRIAEKLARLLDASPKSQEEVAVDTKSKASRVSDWKHGRRRPTIAQLLLLARSLDVPVEYLLDDAMDEPPAPPQALTEAELAVVKKFRRSGLELLDALDRLEVKIEPDAEPSKDEAKPKHRRA